MCRRRTSPSSARHPRLNTEEELRAMFAVNGLAATADQLMQYRIVQNDAFDPGDPGACRGHAPMSLAQRRASWRAT
ncbi:MAG: hypothetical protein R3A10_22760 [Caldilineaceae bacterium]